jgi:hypothetical protein
MFIFYPINRLLAEQLSKTMHCNDRGLGHLYLWITISMQGLSVGCAVEEDNKNSHKQLIGQD